MKSMRAVLENCEERRVRARGLRYAAGRGGSAGVPPAAFGVSPKASGRHTNWLNDGLRMGAGQSAGRRLVRPGRSRSPIPTELAGLRPNGLILALVLLMTCTFDSVAGGLGSLPVELQLIWATNEPKSPNPKHKPVGPEVQKMLEESPYRWKYYFEVNRLVVDVPSERSLEKVTMSRHCALDIKYLGKSRGVEHMLVKLYGDGKLVSMHKESLPLLLAGNANNGTAWFVLIRKAPPGAKADVAGGN